MNKEIPEASKKPASVESSVGTENLVAKVKAVNAFAGLLKKNNATEVQPFKLNQGVPK